MSRLPRISIITPSFNQAPFLERTIRSVLNQGYPNLEYLIADGGSTDGSVDIIRRYGPRLAWWRSRPDRGQTDAINEGLTHASGDVIAFLNSDDVYLPGALRSVAEHFARPSATRWLIGQCQRIDADDRDLEPFVHRMPESLAKYLMRTSGFLPQPSCFWHADLFRRHGAFDVGLHYSFDYEYHCRLLFGGQRPRLIDQPLAALRVHAASKGESQRDRFTPERLLVARRYARRLPIAQRLELARNLGYRGRLFAIASARQGQRPLWPQVLRRPWWLASADVRAALREDLLLQREAA